MGWRHPDYEPRVGGPALWAGLAVFIAVVAAALLKRLAQP